MINYHASNLIDKAHCHDIVMSATATQFSKVQHAKFPNVLIGACLALVPFCLCKYSLD